MHFNAHGVFSHVCVHVPGKPLVVADVLSCNLLCGTDDQELDEGISAHIDHVMTMNKPITDTRQQVNDQMRDGPVLRAAIIYTVSGGPKYQCDVSEDL